MLCESCKHVKGKFMREIVEGNKSTNIFLCEDCEQKHAENLKSLEENIA